MGSNTSSPIKLSSPATGEFWEIPVLFESNEVLVLDKPGCVLTAPDKSNPDRPSLSRLIQIAIREGKPWAVTRQLTFLANAHRLDFEVSGPLIFAKNDLALRHFTNLFGSEKPLVESVVLVQGGPADEQFEVAANLAPDDLRPGMMKTVASGGKKSITRFEVLERFRGWTLLKCYPLTQRLHQVRVHLRSIRHPIAGDHDYGGRSLLLSSFKPNYRLKPGRRERPLLESPIIHVQRLQIEPPNDAAPLLVSSEWPKPLAVAVKYLREFAAV